MNYIEKQLYSIAPLPILSGKNGQFKEIKEMYAAGNSTWEVLAEVIEQGVEFLDAVYRISQALKLDAEETAEMIKKYSTYC